MFDILPHLDPYTGKAYQFGSGFGPGQWAYSDDLSGVSLDPTWLQKLGFSGSALDSVAAGGSSEDGNTMRPSADLQSWLSSNGYRIARGHDGAGSYLAQVFDASGNPIGSANSWSDNDDPGNLVGIGWGAMLGGWGAATALGAGAASAGAAGEAGSYAVPYSAYAGPGSEGYLLAGDVAAAPAEWGTAAASGGGLSSADLAALYGAEGYGAAVSPAELAAAAGGAAPAASSSWLDQAGNLLKGVSGKDWLNVAGGVGNALIGSMSTNRAVDSLTSAAAQANALWQPYRDLGTQAVGQYRNLLQDPRSITKDPGYQFSFDQGLNAIDRSAASKGSLYSGATLRALDKYGQGLASQQYDNALSRYGNAAQLGANGISNTANNTTNLGSAIGAAQLGLGTTYGNALSTAIGAINYGQNNNSIYKPVQIGNQLYYPVKP